MNEPDNKTWESKEEMFKFWESDLRYRIREEEKKYNNESSRENGIDWVEMIICKSLKDMIKETEELLSTQKKQIIDQYTKFLLKNGYVDDDVWAEEPKVQERFIESLEGEE